jgi:hypothetical protein
VLNRETANFLKNNSDAFAQLVRECTHIMERFSFVFYLTRLDPREKAFPMAILPSVQGQAADSTLPTLSVARQILSDEGAPLRGLAFDGDLKYLCHLEWFKTRINDLQKINIQGPLRWIITHEGPGIFEDTRTH